MLIPKTRRPITPGAVLREDFLEPMGLTQGQFADALRVNRTTINEIVNAKRAISPEMALRIGHTTRTAAEYWLRLQLAVDLYDALHSPKKAEIEQLSILIA